MPSSSSPSWDHLYLNQGLTRINPWTSSGEQGSTTKRPASTLTATVESRSIEDVMSSHNNTAPRFRAQAASPLGGGSSFSSSHHHHTPHQVSEIPPRLASTISTPIAAPLATPYAPLPAPRHLSAAVAAAASQQPLTRGARFSTFDYPLGVPYGDEDDGSDDIDFLSNKMAALGGNDRNATQYQNLIAAADLQRRVQAQHQLLQLQIAQQQQQQQQQQAQAQAFQSLILQTTDPSQLREAMALLELQRAQLAATTPSTHLERAYAQQAAGQQLLAQRILQQQQIMALQLQQQQHQQQQGHQRQALTAQLEAGTLRRERERERQERRRDNLPELSPDHERARAAFENTPSGYFPPISPPLESAAGVGWTTFASGSGVKTPTAPFAEWPFGGSSNNNNNNNSPSASTRTSSTDSHTRAPSPSVITSSPTPPSAPPSAALGRFARARQELAAAQAAAPGATPLAALLSRGRSVDEDTISLSSVATSPISETGPYPSSSSRKWSMESASGRQVASDSGHLTMKDPVSFLEWGYLPPAPRSQSFSSYTRPTTVDVTRRQQAVVNSGSSSAVPSLIIRQPYGPPGSVDELSQKNFASNIRRQAGINLGMLGRRTDGTESETS